MTYEDFVTQTQRLYQLCQKYSRQGNDTWYEATLQKLYDMEVAHPDYAKRLHAEIMAEIEADDAAREAHYKWLAEQDARTAAI